MPSNVVAIFTKGVVFEFADCPSPKIVVMVKYPDFSFQLVLLKQRTKSTDKLNFVLLRPDARWHSAILISVHLILRGNRRDRHPLCPIRLQEFYEILRVVPMYLLRIDPPSIEPFAFIQPGGLHGDENK